MRRAEDNTVLTYTLRLETTLRKISASQSLPKGWGSDSIRALARRPAAGRWAPKIITLTIQQGDPRAAVRSPPLQAHLEPHLRSQCRAIVWRVWVRPTCWQRVEATGTPPGDRTLSGGHSGVLLLLWWHQHWQGHFGIFLLAWYHQGLTHPQQAGASPGPQAVHRPHGDPPNSRSAQPGLCTGILPCHLTIPIHHTGLDLWILVQGSLY